MESANEMVYVVDDDPRVGEALSSLLRANGKIERFDCYPVLSIMLKQMGVLPDFGSAVKRSTQR